MPTKNPRLQITLDKDTYDVLFGLSEITNTSMSSFVRQVIEVSLPGWKGMLDVARQYRTLNEDQLAGFNMAAEAFDRITSLMVEAMQEASPEDPKAARKASRNALVIADAGRDALPPSCNTGVRIH